MADIEDEGCSCCGCVVLLAVLLAIGLFGQSCVHNVGKSFERGRQEAITEGYRERSEIERGKD